MNKKFTKLIAAIALLTFLIPFTGWGQTNSSVTMAYSGSTTTNMTGNNDAALVGLDATDWSVVGAKGANSNFPGLNKAGDIRLYYHQDGSNTITVTALNDNFTISSIVITYTSSDYNNGKVFVGNNEVTLENGAYAINSTSFVVTNGNTSNVQVRISSIEINYTSGGGANPEITIPAAQLSLSYEENLSGSFDVTYTNSFVPFTAFAKLYTTHECNDGEEFPAPGDEEWIMLDEEDLTDPAIINYMVEANTSTAERTVYMYVEAMDNSTNVISAVFTITQAGVPTYTVTYDCNGGTSGCPNPSIIPGYTSGTQIQLADAPSRDDYVFDGWSDGTNTYGENEDYTVTGDVTFTAQWSADPSAPTYEWVETALADLGTSDVFVIVGDNGSSYAMTNNNGTSSAPAASAVTVENGKITSTVDDNLKWNISGNATDGYTFYPDGSTTTWLYCTNTNNGVRVGTNASKTFVINSGYLYHSGTSRHVGIYNSQDWRCYSPQSGNVHSNISGQTFTFYKRQVPTTDPSISASDVNIEYDATGGTIAYTLSNATGNVTAAVTSGDWINLGTITATEVPFTCSANTETTARTAQVTLSFTGATDKIVTITQAAAPVVYTTIPAIFAAATSTETDVTITFNNWVVSGVKNNNAYLTDNAGNGLIIYQSGHGFAVNDVLSGTASCKLVLYNGSAELKNLTSTTTGLTVTANGTVTEQNIAINSLTGVNTGALLHYDNLTYNGTALLDADNNSITPYSTFYSYTFENGKTYNVTGMYLQYNTTKEILPRSAADIVEVISTTSTISVAPTSLSGFTYEEGNGPSTAKTTFVSGNALTEDISLSLGDNSVFEMSTTEGSGYANSLTLTPTGGVVDATTIYVRLKAGLDVNASYSGTITLTSTGATSCSVSLSGSVTAYMAPYATLPFAFDGGRADIATTAGLTHDGLDSDYASSPKLKFNSTDDYVILQINERPGILSFDIKGNTFSGGTFKVQTSEDGSTYSDLGTYTAFGSSGNDKFDDEEYTNLGENVRYIKWIYTDKSNGNVALGDIKLAVYVAPSTEPTISVAPATVDNVVAAGDDGTLALTYANLTIAQANDFGIQFYDDNDQELNGSDEPVWIAVIVEDGTNSGEYQVSYIVDANNGVERTAYFKVFASDGTDFVYSNLVTITQEEYVAPVPSTTYTLATSIISGKRYIITNGTNKAMGAQNTNNRAAVDVTIDAGVATVSSDDVYEFVIIGPDVDSLYTIYDVSNEKYLNAAGTGSSNYLKLQDPITDRGLWTITFSNDAAVITAKTTATDRKNMRYNNGSTCFSCYGTGQQPIYLFAKDNETTSTITKNIDAYTDERDHYYLIASPFGQVTPTTGNNFLVNNYDLYAFNQAEDDEWRNYKAESFNLISGRGYLYANSADVELTFEGMPYVGNGQVMLAYTDGKEFAGWNLIGNPYNDNATVSDTLAYYTLNSDGSELAAVAAGSGNSVGAMEGIFVKVDKANQSVKFTKATAKGNTERNTNLVLSLNGNNGNVIDRTIVRFDEGQTLPKFMLNPQNTKLYIPQSDKDYAVVRSTGQGEMPLNFKAAKNGTYTLSIETKDVEMDYLLLIDNLTGANIDLLATPSYTFNAKTTDYASRFRLMFDANSVDEYLENANFAYFNGSEWVVNATEDATLQVIDMMGRVLVSTKGTNSLSTNSLTQGVYMLRLINNGDVKTQKIVVR